MWHTAPQNGGQLVESFKVALAQINPTVGDLRENLERIVAFAGRAREAGARARRLPRTGLCRATRRKTCCSTRSSCEECRAALDEAARRCAGIDAVVGFPEADGGDVHNAAALLRDGAVAGVSRKIELPNYGVFDEHRYFTPGAAPLLVDVGGVGCLITICEDIWVAGGAVERLARERRPGLVLNLSASPFHAGKLAERHARRRALRPRREDARLLHEPRRRAGRAGLRRRQLRGGRRRADRRGRTALRRGPAPRRVRPGPGRHAWPRRPRPPPPTRTVSARSTPRSCSAPATTCGRTASRRP